MFGAIFTEDEVLSMLSTVLQAFCISFFIGLTIILVFSFGAVLDKQLGRSGQIVVLGIFGIALAFIFIL